MGAIELALLVVSAYALFVVATEMSFAACLLRLSSSSWISFIDFLTTGAFAGVVQTGVTEDV